MVSRSNIINGLWLIVIATTTPELTLAILEQSFVADKPEIIYKTLKENEDSKTKPLVDICKSLRGDCDLSPIIDFDRATTSTKNIYQTYRDYCYKQWLVRCDAQEAFRVQIAKTLGVEQRDDARSLINSILTIEGPTSEKQLKDLRRSYPQAIVEYMRNKEADNLTAIQTKDDKVKRSEFRKIFDRTALALCNLVIDSMQKHVEALEDWVRENSIPDDKITPLTWNWLKVYRICSRIEYYKELAKQYSYRYFVGKKTVDDGIISSIRKKLRSGLGADTD